MPRGKGVRCTGFLTSDGAVAFCSRSEKAGDLRLDETTDPAAYAHRMTGDCGCGAVHGDTQHRPVKPQIVATYPYQAADGTLLFEVVRYFPKTFKQRRPNGAGGWEWNLKGISPVPYRLPELLASDGPVYVCEGEKDVDRLLALGAAATTAPGGAGKWRQALAAHLRGRSVVILPDNDPMDVKGRRPGQDGALAAAILFTAEDIECRILDLPGLPADGGDVSDWLDADPSHGVELLAKMAADTPIFTPDPMAAAPVPSGDGIHAFTDTRNAQRLVARYGEDLRFDHTRGQWRIWNGVVWAQDEIEGVMRRAKEIVREMHTEVRAMDLDQKEYGRAIKDILLCESQGRLRSMLENARCEVHATHKTWDPDPWLLNCQNGTIDLRSGELLAHRPERWQSKLAPVDYDAAATCPRWDAFLDRIFAGDAELIEFVQRSVGLSLVGAVIEHVLYVLWGTGANGKSTFLNVILNLLGDYGRAASSDLLLHRDMPQHSTNIAELRGVRLVSTVEGAGRFNETLVKLLTGGDIRNARFMHQDAFTYTPSDTFWLATNHKPVVQGNSEGIWRRLRLIPFSVAIPPEEQDHNLAESLRTEYPGILAWAVRGCLAWQREGLKNATAVTDATAGYRTEMDTFNAFLEEHCVRDPNATVASAELYKAYSSWCAESGEKVASQRFLGIRLGEHGFTRARMSPSNRWGWQGLRMRGEDELFVEPDLPERELSGTPRAPAVSAVPMVAADDDGAPHREHFETDDQYTSAMKTYWAAKGEPV